MAFLGHCVGRDGIRPDRTKLEAVDSFAVRDVASLRSFLGLASYYRRFVPQFAELAHPLHRLLRKSAPWNWGSAQEEAVRRLKETLTSEPVLCHYDADADVSVTTDASIRGLGAVLHQNTEEGERPVAYVSRQLSPAEENYSANELECLALVWALGKLRPYLYGRGF